MTRRARYALLIALVALVGSALIIPAGASDEVELLSIGVFDESKNEFANPAVACSFTEEPADSAFPFMLHTPDARQSHPWYRISCGEVTVTFDINGHYVNGVLSYARFGGESDYVTLTGPSTDITTGPLTNDPSVVQCNAPTDGCYPQTHHIDVGTLPPGSYTLTITPTSSSWTTDGYYWFDAVALTGEEPLTPQSEDDCKKGGWQNFTHPPFGNQGECVSYVVSMGKGGGEAPASPADACKDGGWTTFSDPNFKNQGDCVSYFATDGDNPAAGDDDSEPGEGGDGEGNGASGDKGHDETHEDNGAEGNGHEPGHDDNGQDSDGAGTTDGDEGSTGIGSDDGGEGHDATHVDNGAEDNGHEEGHDDNGQNEDPAEVLDGDGGQGDGDSLDQV